MVDEFQDYDEALWESNYQSEIQNIDTVPRTIPNKTTVSKYDIILDMIVISYYLSIIFR